MDGGSFWAKKSPPDEDGPVARGRLGHAQTSQTGQEAAIGKKRADTPPLSAAAYGGGAPAGTEAGVVEPAAGVVEAGVVWAFGPQPEAVQMNALITIMLRSAFIVFLLLGFNAR